MKHLKHCLAACLLASASPMAVAETATATFDVGFASVDDHGGYEAYHDFDWNGQSHVASAFFVAYDAYTGALDSPYNDSDNDWGNNNSGIRFDTREQFPEGLPSCIEGIAYSNSEFAPASFTGTNTGLEVSYYAITGADDPWVIHFYDVYNPTDSDVYLHTAMLSDFDVANGSTDQESGFDDDLNTVWQYDANDDVMMAVSSLEMEPDNYLLEFCCSLTYGTDDNIINFLVGDPAWSGDQGAAQGQDSDREVSMSFDHGNLGSGSSAAMVFVQTAANGDSSNEALIDIEANLEAAFQCLTAPPEPPEPLADVPVPTLSPAGLAALMLLMFGGFAWHRRRMG